MADITLKQSRGRVYLFPETDVGKNWIEKEMIVSSQTVVNSVPVISIQSDVLEDFIQTLEDADVSYDVL